MVSEPIAKPPDSPAFGRRARVQVQLNDPDPEAWVLSFVLPAGVLLLDVTMRCMRRWRKGVSDAKVPQHPPIPAAAWVAASTVSVMLGATVAADAFAALRRDGFYTLEAFTAETLREFTGQAMVVVWMMVNAAVSFFSVEGGKGASATLRSLLAAAALAVPAAVIAAWVRWNAAVAGGEVEVAPHCSGMISDVQASPAAALTVASSS